MKTKLLVLRLIIIAFLFTGCSKRIYNFSDSTEVFKTREGKDFPVSSLSENTLILIFSYECGYSLFNSGLFNEIKKRCTNPDVNFVVFTEISKDVSFAKYPQYEEHLRGDLEWDVIDNQRDFYMQLLREEIFPKLIYIKNGKRVLRIKGVPKIEESENLIQLLNERS